MTSNVSAANPSSEKLYLATLLSNLKVNEPFAAALDDDRGDVVLVLNAEGQVVAFPDRCSHADVPLSAGSCSHGEIECPAHGARFSLATGAVTCAPAVAPLKKLAVEIRGDEVWVEEA